MSKSNFYLLVSLPTSITSTGDHDEAFGALQATVSGDSESTSRFAIPEFSIGTLDALVQQADELSKLESQCEVVVNKVGESLRSILEGDEEKVAQQKTVNDSEILLQTRCELWLKLYRAGRPVLTTFQLE